MAPKIIVLGEINGQLKQVFTKVASLHAKNSFTICIVCGNLFSEDPDSASELLAGKISIPLPTYFTVGTKSLPPSIIDKIKNEEEICLNLYFLGKRSTTMTTDGIKIVTLGGQFEQSTNGVSKEKHVPFHTVADAKALHGANTADILITTCWPAAIGKYSKVRLAEGAVPPSGHEHIADLLAVLKPRYHFSVSPEFFEREAFCHEPSPDAPENKLITRFISLAAHGVPKQKSIYAFTLPMPAEITTFLPPGATSSPYSDRQRNNKRQALEDGSYPRFGTYDYDFGHRNKRGMTRRGQRNPPPGPGECFFCLSNPNLATHLISSIGDDSYLTIAKGPLTTPFTYSQYGIDFPAHTLIIPLTHSPTLASVPEGDGSRERTFAEMNKFKNSLQNMVAKKSLNKLGAVTYEISKVTGIHTHWQFIPVPQDNVNRGLVEAAFKVEAENRLYPPFESRDPGIGLSEGDFFRVWIWSPPSEQGAEGTAKCIIMPFDESVRFDSQFGRIVLAKLLGLERRIQWRDCAQTEDEEKKDISAFKAAFQAYSFTT